MTSFIVNPEDIIYGDEIYNPSIDDAEIAKLEARKNKILGEERIAKQKAARLKQGVNETADELGRIFHL